jgi:hypothetical protein
MKVIFLIAALAAAAPALASTTTPPSLPTAPDRPNTPVQDGKLTPSPLRLREQVLYDGRSHLLNPHEPSRQNAVGPGIG